MEFLHPYHALHTTTDTVDRYWGQWASGKHAGPGHGHVIYLDDAGVGVDGGEKYSLLALHTTAAVNMTSAGFENCEVKLSDKFGGDFNFYRLIIFYLTF